MNTLDQSIQDRILAVLRQQRRFAALENLFMSLLCAAFSVALTIGAFWVLIFGCLFFLSPFGVSKMAPAGFLLIPTFMFVIFGGLGRRQLLDGPLGPPRIRFFSTGTSEEALAAAWEMISGLVLSGPRCVVLAFRFAVFARKTLRADINEFVRPIEIALGRNRKTRAQDLPGIDLADFLKKAEWIDGVVPLYREPAGFVLTQELREKILGSRYHAEPEPELKNEPVELLNPADEELRWALLIMGLPAKPTRKEINTAYRNLAKLVHPDVQTEASERQGNEERMKDLNLAYEILRQRF